MTLSVHQRAEDIGEDVVQAQGDFTGRDGYVPEALGQISTVGWYMSCSSKVPNTIACCRAVRKRKSSSASGEYSMKQGNATTPSHVRSRTRRLSGRLRATRAAGPLKPEVRRLPSERRGQLGLLGMSRQSEARSAARLVKSGNRQALRIPRAHNSSATVVRALEGL